MTGKQMTRFMRWCERCEMPVSAKHRKIMDEIGEGRHQPVSLYSNTGRTHRGKAI